MVQVEVVFVGRGALKKDVIGTAAASSGPSDGKLQATSKVFTKEKWLKPTLLT